MTDSTSAAATSQEREREKRDREAERYDAFFPDWRNRAETAAVVREARRSRGRGLLVDLGAGTGRILRALAPSFGRAVGVDFSAASLEVARRGLPAHVDLVVANAVATGLPGGEADVVTCVQLLQHLPSEHLRDALVAEAHRLLRPGGWFVVTCYGRNLRHRLRPREGTDDDLYWYRHSPRDLARRLRRRFPRPRTRAIVGLPDAVGSIPVDAALSRLPAWALLGRTSLGVARRGVDP